ncbi:MAG: glycosyl hydrolase 2 galactose-binding domain-containing protein, partial [Bacteroidota bacterium]
FVQQELLLHEKPNNSIITAEALISNELVAQAADQSWTYETVFQLNETSLKYDHVDLVFDGVDTYGSVYLNDSLLGNVNNMFRQWRFSSKKYLNQGSNKLRVQLMPVVPQANALLQQLPYRIPSSDPVDPPVSPFVRKAPYQFGWYWSPRMLSIGIWRPVRMEMYDGVRIASTYFSVKEISDSIAWMNARIELGVNAKHAEVVIKVEGAFKQFEVDGNDTVVDITFRVLNPKLWWPKGLGEQNQYDFKVLAYADGFLVDSSVVRTGIRTAELIMEPDNYGTSFYFKINGKRIFAQGANYVPQRLLPGIVGDADKVRLLSDAASVGMNMLRVWVGGVYEHDRFYEICDSLGLMVWQDFMFACSMYPSDSLFMSNVEAEVQYQVKRLRNHPSLVVWCGNNESDVAWKNWGWQKQYGITPTDSTTIRNGYDSIFQKAIPQLISHNASSIPYIHNSPLSNWGKRRNFDHLNMHYWGVWHGEEAIDSFRVNVPRFMSEYGMQSWPHYEKLKTSSGDLDISLDSQWLASRQKSYKGNRLLLDYIQKRYGKVSSTEEFCYLSQLHQADAMSIAIESQRMDYPRCMGTLYWQLNDVWNGASWSTIEEDGKWKAAHYALKRLYAPSLLSYRFANGRAEVWYQTHAPSYNMLNLECHLSDLDGNQKGFFTVSYKDSTNLPQLLLSIPMDSLLYGCSINNVYWDLKVFSKDQVMAETVALFSEPSKMELIKPEPEFIMKRENDGHLIKLGIRSNTFAKGFEIDFNGVSGKYSDNFIDLLPGVWYWINFEPVDTKEINESDIKFNWRCFRFSN